MGIAPPRSRSLHGVTNFGGVVEDTMQGSLAVPGDRGSGMSGAVRSLRAHSKRWRTVRSVAPSPTLETILRSRFFRIPVETRIGVLGYGGIGEGTAASLRG